MSLITSSSGLVMFLLTLTSKHAAIRASDLFAKSNEGDFEIPSFFDERLNNAFKENLGSSVFTLPSITPSEIDGDGHVAKGWSFNLPDEGGSGSRGHQERDESSSEASGVRIAGLLSGRATPSGDKAKQDVEHHAAEERSDELPSAFSAFSLPLTHPMEDHAASDESTFEGRQIRGNRKQNSEAAMAAFLNRLPGMERRRKETAATGESNRRKFTPKINKAAAAVEAAADESEAAFKKELDELIKSESINKSSSKVKPVRSGAHGRRPPGLRRRGPSTLVNSNPGGSRLRSHHGVGRPRVRLPVPPPPVSTSAGAGGSSGFIPISPPGSNRNKGPNDGEEDQEDGFKAETAFDKAGLGGDGSRNQGSLGTASNEPGPPYTTLSEILTRNTTRLLDEGKDNAYSQLQSPSVLKSGFAPSTPSSSPISLVANAVAKQADKLPPFIAKIVEEKLTEEDDALLSILRNQDGCMQMFTEDLCLEVGDYPRKQILRSIARSGHLVDFSLAEIDQQDADMLLEGVTSAQEKRYTYDHYFGVTKTGLENHKHRDFASEGGFLCPSDIKYARPHMARSAAKNEWKYIVNAGQYTQTVRLEKCLKPMDSCSYVSYHYKSECSQVHNFQRLLSWTPDIGIHMDIYKVPVACSCHIKGYSYQYPPVASTTASTTTGVDGQPTNPSDDGQQDFDADTDDETFPLHEDLQPYEDNVPHTLFYPVQPDLFRPPNRFKPPVPISLFSSPASAEGSIIGPGSADGDTNAHDFIGRSPWRRRPTFSHQSPVSRVDDLDAAGSEFIESLANTFTNGNGEGSSSGSEGSPLARLKSYRRVNYTYHPIVDFMARRMGEPRSLKRSSSSDSPSPHPQIDSGLTDFLLGKSNMPSRSGTADVLSSEAEATPVTGTSTSYSHS